jgi:hypothetical protein
MSTVLNKAVTRETRMEIRDRSKRRSLMVTLLPGDVVELRPKGTRARVMVDIETVWQLAMKLEAARVRDERAKARKAKKG